MSGGGGRPELSVVVPVFDERDNLEPLVAELLDVLPATAHAFEILLVDDGSGDGSAETIATLARSRPGVRGLHLDRRRGQTAALDAGFKAAAGAVVVTLDADLQMDPRDIPRLLEALPGHDAAIGYRTVRRDGLVRRASSRVANAVRNLVSGDRVRDSACPLKAFRRECVAGLALYDGMHRFLPTLLRMEGRRVVEVPVGHRRRRSGRGKYGIRNRLPRALADLLAVRWMRKRRLDYEVVRHEP